MSLGFIFGYRNTCLEMICASLSLGLIFLREEELLGADKILRLMIRLDMATVHVPPVDNEV